MLDSLSVFIAGFLLNISLILAIGPQNSFILRQGLRGDYVGIICLICILSDVLLIFTGVFALEVITKYFPTIIIWVKYLGVFFLLFYGGQHLISAIKPMAKISLRSNIEEISLKKAILVCLALTWLNPYVYFDTVFLIGAISTQYGSEKVFFALGAVLATILYFLALGYGSKFLRPIFQNARAWQYLDFVMAIILFVMAWKISTYPII